MAGLFAARLVVILSCLQFTGCAAVLLAPVVIGVPINTAMIVRTPDGNLTRWTGTIMGRPLDTSSFNLKREDSAVTCSGTVSKSGKGAVKCDNGTTIPFNSPPELYGKLNGSYVERAPNGAVLAAGWGNDADFDRLEKLMARR